MGCPKDHSRTQSSRLTRNCSSRLSFSNISSHLSHIDSPQHEIGVFLFMTGRTIEAKETLEACLAAQQEHGVDERARLCTAHDLAVTLGSNEDALTLTRSVLQRRERLLGLAHPDSLATLRQLGLILRDAGRLSDSASVFRKCVERWQHVCTSSEDPRVKASKRDLASVMHMWHEQDDKVKGHY